MGLSLNEFARAYYRAAEDMVSVMPARTPVPSSLKNTSFVIACSDVAGRCSVDIIGRENIRELAINGSVVAPVPGGCPGFIVAENLQSIADLVFAQDDRDNSVSITIDVNNVVLDGLAFSSKKYNDQYWIGAKFYRNCAGSIPFLTGPNGSILGLNILWGHEVGGCRQERLFEFIKMYGRYAIPTERTHIQDDVAQDIFRSITNNIGGETWSFTDFLNKLREPVDSNVLILGPYGTDEEFEQLNRSLNKLGYNGFLLKDAPDIPVQSNLEKLYAAMICSCFIVVMDKRPSGHIAELAELLRFRSRPVIIIRGNGRPSTTFLEDKLETDDYFKIAVVNDVSPSTLLPYVKWARGVIGKQIANFNRINSWRTESILEDKIPC